VTNEIVPFTDGTSALAYLLGPDGTGRNNAGKPLLILLDLNLPDMTGVDILQIVKENEHLRRAPVVILTTTDDQREIQRCYDLGCNVYITKPVNYEGFANAIRQLGLFFSVIQVPEAA
jgi:CheY-like chemotaxis protein